MVKRGIPDFCSAKLSHVTTIYRHPVSRQGGSRSFGSSSSKVSGLFIKANTTIDPYGG